MNFYCDVCDKLIKPKSKNKHFKPNTHKDLDKSKHWELTIKNPDINNLDRELYGYIIEPNKKIWSFPYWMSLYFSF